MLGFKQFKNAAITIAGIELMHRIRRDSSTSRRASKRPLRRLFGRKSFRPDHRTKIASFLASTSYLHQSRSDLGGFRNTPRRCVTGSCA